MLARGLRKKKTGQILNEAERVAIAAQEEEHRT